MILPEFLNALFLQIPSPDIPVIPADSIPVVLKEKLSWMASIDITTVFNQFIQASLRIILKIITALIVFYVGKWLIQKVYKIALRGLTKRNVELSLTTFVLSTIRIATMLLLLVTVIGILGINTSSFIAVFASAGVAVGMALSGTLQNFAGGVMILLLKPYRVGDVIEAQGYTGKVTAIQIFSTIINTGDNKTIIIPNGGLSTGTINNYSKTGIRRVEWVFGIAYGDNYDAAKETIFELLAQNPKVMTEPAPFVALQNLSASSVDILVRAWCDVNDFWDVYFYLNEVVYKEFGSKGLNFPFPQMDVHIQPDEN